METDHYHTLRNNWLCGYFRGNIHRTKEDCCQEKVGRGERITHGVVGMMIDKLISIYNKIYYIMPNYSHMFPQSNESSVFCRSFSADFRSSLASCPKCSSYLETYSSGFFAPVITKPPSQQNSIYSDPILGFLCTSRWGKALPSTGSLFCR